MPVRHPLFFSTEMHIFQEVVFDNIISLSLPNPFHRSGALIYGPFFTSISVSAGAYTRSHLRGAPVNGIWEWKIFRCSPSLSFFSWRPIYFAVRVAFSPAVSTRQLLYQKPRIGFIGLGGGMGDAAPGNP